MDVELVICIGRLGEKKIILEKKPLSEIDRITTKFEDSKKLRESKKYSEKIQIFKDRYDKYLAYLSDKNNRKENGNITILGTVNKEKTRIMALYEWHIKVVNYVTMKDAEFVQYIKSRDYNKYSLIQHIKTITPDDIKEDWISWAIRKAYQEYEQYAKDNKKLSPKAIYRHIKTVEYTMNQDLEKNETQLEKDEALLKKYRVLSEKYEMHHKYKKLQDNIDPDDYQEIYDESNNEPTYPKETISCDAIEREENKAYYYSLNFPERKEQKGRQKKITKKNQWGKVI